LIFSAWGQSDPAEAFDLGQVKSICLSVQRGRFPAGLDGTEIRGITDRMVIEDLLLALCALPAIGGGRPAVAAAGAAADLCDHRFFLMVERKHARNGVDAA
jgi:hypothetical protein